MKFDKQNLLLYAVTDRSWLGEKTLFQQVEEALQGGVTMLQLREKDLDEKILYGGGCCGEGAVRPLSSAVSN